MDWELTKENCAPVRQGRSKAALQELADPALEALDAKRRELWAEITEYKGDDPLEPWQRYIKWMQEYGLGGGKADLLKVLEACTKELQKYPRYRSDIRFLRMWIQYADCLPDPDDVFLFLKEKGIGRDFALYYEAYATYFELKGNFQAADAVYMDGIQRGVKQLERLKHKHIAFQQRMAQRIQRRIQDEQVMGPPPQEPVRANLVSIGLRGAGRGHHGHQQQARSAAGIFGVAAAPESSSKYFVPRPGPAQHDRGPHPIVGLYEDEDLTGGENPRPSRPGYSMMPQSNNVRELKPYGVRRKENLDRAIAWNQAPLMPVAAPSAAPLAGTAGGIAIFTDEEFQDGSDDLAGRAGVPVQLQHGGAGPAVTGPSTGQSSLPPGTSRTAGWFAAGDAGALMFTLAPPRTLVSGLPPGPAHSVSESTAALSVLGLSTAGQQPQTPRPPDALATAPGPLTRYTDGAVASRGDHAAGLNGMPASAETEASAPGATEAGFNHEDAGIEEEMSYEERKAAAWFRDNPIPWREGPATAGVGTGSGSGSTSATLEDVQQKAAEPTSSARPHMPPGEQTGSSDTGNAAGACVACGTGRGDAASSGAAPRRAPLGQVLPAAAAVTGLQVQKPLSGSSMTVLENGPAHESHQRRPIIDAARAARNPLGRHASGSVGPSFTTARPLGAEVVPLPQPLQSGAHVSPAACDADHVFDDAQPTVTISTRGAFDLINSLFSEDLPHQKARGDQKQLQPSSSRVDAQPLPAAPALPPAPAVPEARPPFPQPQAVQPASLSAPKQPLVPEPTVTLHTKLAFDALNDMFCDTLPHEEVRKLARRHASDGGAAGGATHIKPITASDVCRLANAARSSTTAAPGAGRRNPLYSVDGGGTCTGACFGGTYSGSSETNTVMANGFAGAASSLAIHEDTFFLGQVPAASCSDTMRGPLGGGVRAALPLDPEHISAHQPDMPAMYEDTEFIPRGGVLPSCGNGNAAPSCGTFILEDTEFVTRHNGTNVTAASLGGYDRCTKARSDSTTALAPTAAPSGRLGSRGLCAARAGNRATISGFQQRSLAKGTLQVYEDTLYDLDE